ASRASRRRAHGRHLEAGAVGSGIDIAIGHDDGLGAIAVALDQPGQATGTVVVPGIRDGEGGVLRSDQEAVHDLGGLGGVHGDLLGERWWCVLVPSPDSNRVCMPSGRVAQTTYFFHIVFSMGRVMCAISRGKSWSTAYSTPSPVPSMTAV